MVYVKVAPSATVLGSVPQLAAVQSVRGECIGCAVDGDGAGDLAAGLFAHSCANSIRNNSRHYTVTSERARASTGRISW